MRDENAAAVDNRFVDKELLLYNSPEMADQRERIQIDMPKDIQRRAKAVALDRDMPLVQLVLLGLSKVGDKKLADLVEKYLAEKAKPGRPQK